ncbi:MAG: Rrf2 family transcriptional regulator [Planctomycetota bacterium]
MKISRTVAYAVQALLQLSAVPDGRPVACGRLAAEGHMPERFLLQVLRSLVESGILRSVRGVDGGYLLDRDPAEVSLLEIVQAFEHSNGPLVPDLEGLPDYAQQQLLIAMARVADAEREQLSRVSMADLRPASPPASPPATP